MRSGFAPLTSMQLTLPRTAFRVHVGQLRLVEWLARSISSGLHEIVTCNFMTFEKKNTDLHLTPVTKMWFSIRIGQQITMNL